MTRGSERFSPLDCLPHPVADWLSKGKREASRWNETAIHHEFRFGAAGLRASARTMRTRRARPIHARAALHLVRRTDPICDPMFEKAAYSEAASLATSACPGVLAQAASKSLVF